MTADETPPRPQDALVNQLLGPGIRYTPTPIEVLRWRALHDEDEIAREVARVEAEIELRKWL